MIELIIMAGVVYWYFQSARRNGQNGYLWGAIGAASYYVPVLVVGQLIIPAILPLFVVVTVQNRPLIIVMSIAVTLAAGIACCVTLKRVMARRWKT